MSTVTEKYKSREEILYDEGIRYTYERAQILAEWDKENRGKREPPPKLSAAERQACAECVPKLKALKAGYTELICGLEKYRQAHEQAVTELRRLEKTLLPDDVEGIRSMIFMRGRLEVIVNYVNSAPDRIRAVENSGAAILSSLDKLLSKRFGATREAGGTIWANVGMGGVLGTRIDMALAEIERRLA
ncbi:MAG TPA: hypothetical protein VN836_12880 [Verrucomicrobiae bacterium]|nr:hypothetical protein [Verrucomicrobiae bacterium]